MGLTLWLGRRISFIASSHRPSLFQLHFPDFQLIVYLLRPAAVVYKTLHMAMRYCAEKFSFYPKGIHSLRRTIVSTWCQPKSHYPPNDAFEFLQR